MDMTQCKKGDILLLRNGGIATYVTFDNHGNLLYPHIINLYPHIINHNGISLSVTHNGGVYTDSKNSRDVVDFYTEESKPDGIKEKSYVSYITVCTSASNVPMQNKVKVIGTFKEIMESVSTLHRTVSRDIGIPVKSFEIQTRSPQKDVINIELTLFI